MPDLKIITEEEALREPRTDAAYVVVSHLKAVRQGAIDMTSIPPEVRDLRYIRDAVEFHPGTRWVAPYTMLHIDGVTVHEMAIAADRLPAVVEWLDATFPEWRTRPGEYYSAHAYAAQDYTVDELRTRIDNERFRTGLDAFLERAAREA